MAAVQRDLELAVHANGRRRELLRLHPREQFQVVEPEERRRRARLAQGVICSASSERADCKVCRYTTLVIADAY
jgi:hypothetical protein